jgi:hypothetical protein
MTSTFGPNSQRVLALIASIPGMPGGQVDRVISAWKRVSPRSRAQAWTHLTRITTEDERYQILAAAALARREALDTARHTHRMDWAFWAAACDAAAALTAGSRIGLHYDTLLAPFATAVPALGCPQPPTTPPTTPTTRSTRPRAPNGECRLLRRRLGGSWPAPVQRHAGQHLLTGTPSGRPDNIGGGG